MLFIKTKEGGFMKKILFALWLGGFSLIAMNEDSLACNVECDGNQCKHYQYLLRTGKSAGNAFTAFVKAVDVCNSSKRNPLEYSLQYSLYQETRDSGSAHMTCPCSEDAIKQILQTWSQPFSSDQKKYIGVNDYWTLFEGIFKRETVSIEEIETFDIKSPRGSHRIDN